MTIDCCDNKVRRNQYPKENGLNGIDFVEIDYSNSQLVAHFFDRVATPEFVALKLMDMQTGNLVDISPLVDCPTTSTLCFLIKDLDLAEGHSYQLSVCDPRENSIPPWNFDPQFSSCEFTYNEHVGSEVDFAPGEEPKESVFPAPRINYLAKDYASFRQLVLDRLAITMPNWQETHAADLGMTLVELLAFVADRISYEQDAVATEAYLSTSRRRPSVRRHARLVDYRMHEGCNARAFVHLTVSTDINFNPNDVIFTPEFPSRLQLPTGTLRFDQIPDEVWDSTLAYEPIQSELGDWRLTKEQIKDQASLSRNFLAARNAVAANGGTHDIALPFSKLTNLGLADINVNNLTDVNRWLESVDLIQRLEVDATIQTLQLATFNSQISSLPLRHRNRAILDNLLGEYISPAPILPAIVLNQAHNAIQFYTWCESQCSLPKGATKATLLDAAKIPDDQASCAKSPSDLDWANAKFPLDRRLHLNAGDWLLIEEVKGPLTNNPADADPTKRHIVRLTRAIQSTDPLNQCPILEVEWDEHDKLPFSVCISSKLPPPSCNVISNVSIGRGNIVLVDHGRTLDYQSIGKQQGSFEQLDCGSDWYLPKIEARKGAFRPVRRGIDPTYAQPLPPNTSATTALKQVLAIAGPSMHMFGIPSADGANPIQIGPQLLESNNGTLFENVWRNLGRDEQFVIEDLLDADASHDLYLLSQNNLFKTDETSRTDRCRQLLELIRDRLSWTPRFDLMASGPQEQHFAIECENNRDVTIRFGDGDHGQSPPLGAEFYLRLRDGNGSRGNVGAERIRRIVFRRNATDAIFDVRNPLPSQGGTDPETNEQAKLFAPHAYLKDQPRALRADDYQALVKAKFSDRVQSSRASVTNSATYYWVEVAIDPFASVTDKALLINEVQDYLNRVRKINHLVMVLLQQRVPIDLRMTVKVDLRYPAQTVRQSILERLSNRVAKDGKLGFFHPDNLTFGQSLHSNSIVQEVLKITGVLDVRVEFLGRLGTEPSSTERQAWKEFTLQLNPLEVAELDHLGSKDSGRLCLTLEGGR